MTEDQITDRMAQMIRVGFVNARQPEKMRVKVTVPDTTGAELVTDFLPVLCPRASEDMQYDLPDVGDQVLCLFLPYGLEQGFVIGAMYGKKAPPVQSGDKWHRKFRDGTYLEYDRESHKLVANVQGDVEITATGNMAAKVEGNVSTQSQGPTSVTSQSEVSVSAPAMSFGGVGGATSAAMQGTFNLTSGDIIAEGISLRNHVHTCPACGADTSPPVGSGSGRSGNESGGGSSNPGNDSSQGNCSGSGADAGNGSDGPEGEGGNDGDPALELPPAYASAMASTGFAWTEQGKEQFEETKKQVQLQDNEVFDTILCLPAIAEAKAGNANNENRLGWLYLKQMFEKWLSGKANVNVYENESIFWVDMDWALSYTRVNLAYLKLISRPYLFGPNARIQLASILKRDDFLGKGRIDFDYGDKGWRGWRDGYFQEITANGMEVFPPDGLMAAMGNFQLRALAHGYTEPEGDGHLIVIRGIDVFIWDSFQFEGEFDLGYWRCNPPKFSYEKFPGATNLRNADFRDFQDQIQAGENFLVLSHLNPVDPAVVFSYDTEL